MATEIKEKRKRGGQRKSVEHHKRAGTYRRDRHGIPLEAMGPLEPAKPKHLPESKRRGARPPEDWPITKADELALEAGYWFDIRFAEHFRDFCRKYLRHWEGRWRGDPFELQDWQWKHVFGPLYGWFRYDKELGRPVRRFRMVYIELPKKNGKSPMGAAVGTYALYGDGEGGALVLSIATTKQQANIVHRHAIKYVRVSPDLCDRSKILEHQSVIRYPALDGTYAAVPSDGTATNEGPQVSCLVADELHVWKGRQQWEELRWSFAGRTEPILFSITTAGDDFQSVCREQHDKALRVASGQSVDHSFLGYVAAADDDDDPSDPAVWRKANPSYGTIILESEMRSSWEAAKDSPSEVEAFKRYRLNIWRTSESPWLPYDKWVACGEDYTVDDLIGERCCGALDVSTVRDFTAFVLAFDCADGKVRLLPWFWLPEAEVENKTRSGDFRIWRQHGLLKATPGDVVDYNIVEEDVREIVERFQCEKFAYDPWNAEVITARIEEATGVKRIEFRQGMATFAEPTKRFEKLVCSGGLAHPRHEILDWMIQHCAVETDKNGNIRPIKPKAGDTRKVDGVVCSVMSLSMLGESEPRCIYETRGPVVV